MVRAKQFLDSLNEMGFSRKKWISNLRDKWLGGALKEYSKLKIARHLSLGESTWPRDIAAHLQRATQYLDQNKINTDGTFKREDTFKEAIQDTGFLYKFRPARAAMMKKFPGLANEIEALIWDEDDLIREMIVEFAPQLVPLLPSR